MDPNVNLVLEEMMKELRAEIKEGFAVHEAAFAKRLDKAVACGSESARWLVYLFLIPLLF
jgi:hypothetical protein